MLTIGRYSYIGYPIVMVVYIPYNRKSPIVEKIPYNSNKWQLSPLNQIVKSPTIANQAGHRLLAQLPKNNVEPTHQQTE